MRKTGLVHKLALMAFALILLPNLAEAQSGQNGSRLDLRMQVTRRDRGYLYQYTLRQYDNPRASYQDLSYLTLIFPCGEQAYRSVQDINSGGWTLEKSGSFNEPALRGPGGQVWGLRFTPDSRNRPDQTFTFSFVSECAPTSGKWAARLSQNDDGGDIDVPCGCGDSVSLGDPRDRDRGNSDRDRDRDRNRDYPTSREKQIIVTRNEITIATNTVLKLKMQSRLSSATARVGERFKAVLSDDLTADNLRIFPAGTQVQGRISSVEPARRGGKSGTIGITFDKLVLPSGRTVPIVGELTSLDPEEQRQIDNEGRVSGNSTKRSVVFIGGGAAGGAAIGAIAGGGKGAGVGAAIGAGAGVLGVLLTKGQEAVIEPGTEFGLYLTEPLRIPNAGLQAGGHNPGHSGRKLSPSGR